MTTGGMVMFRRLPRLQWRPRVAEQIVPLVAQAEFPEFADDFAVLERELLPEFRELDNQALRRQNQFRLDQLLLIFGGALAATLGAIQASISGATWPGVAEFLVAGGLTAVAFRQRELRAREKYSASRLKAEGLRSEYFLFLGRIGDYTDETERIRHLIRRVSLILAEQEPKES
ncbi:MAG TPA: DUF4231 domain-containing protein [Chloroflexota bacterium]|nr:DUF4231 domain-containing protein [Chloroflexota bacterium]